MNELILRAKLINTYYEYIIETDGKPYITVNALLNGINAPAEYMVNQHMFVFNISQTAVKKLVIDPSGVSFKANFKGVTQDVFIPTGSIQTIYDALSFDIEFFKKDFMLIKQPDQLSPPTTTTKLRLV